ncbi:MAG TPA: LysM peptidoglycan-binding domain-containing protein [Chloroflexota bacterium]|nr:LysM peptidoglycan-binding domain-containing protein [Chloroflexota bacterium]
MRRSPFDGYQVQVSVEELSTASPLAALQASLAAAQAAIASRWPAIDVGTLLQRRAAAHVMVGTLVAAVLGGSALLAHFPEEAQAPTLAAGVATDGVGITARNAIVARTVPLTSQDGYTEYTVQANDSLPAIARAVGVSEEALLAYNGLTSSDALTVGLGLRIPDLAKVPPDQLRIKDTAPHDASPPLEVPLPPQKASPELTVRTVRKGDTAGALAASFGVSEASLLVSNNLDKDSVLQVGQTLVIPHQNGRLVATKPGDTLPALAAQYGSTPDAIIAANKLPARTREVLGGQLVLIPTGTEPASIVKPLPAPAPAMPAAPATPVTVAKPQTATDEKIPAPPLPASSPGFAWPAPGTITTYFSSWHNGIDIANAAGTPVRAAQAGRVVFSGWDNSGFGYMVRIDHGNGLQTVYGHSEQLIAKVGDYVEKGQVIMLMGSTGRSTGPHVHFSIFQGSGYNGLNPLKYLP